MKDGAIAAIGRIEDKAARTIDAEGLYVAPGFIDVRCHADFTVLDPRNPRDFKLRQGITTECAGQCVEHAREHLGKPGRGTRSVTTELHPVAPESDLLQLQRGVFPGANRGHESGNVDGHRVQSNVTIRGSDADARERATTRHTDSV